MNENGENLIKNKQILIKNSQKQRIFDDFMFWVNGIQEDEPLPFEVKYIYFVLDFSNNDITLSYTGSEIKLPFFELSLYSLLEGEYFFSGELNILSHQLFDYKKKSKNKNSISKQDAFNMLQDIVFAGTKKLKFLNGKRVFFGFKNKKVYE